jgi:hypothetical protein
MNQKKLVQTEDPFNDAHQERQEVEMLAKKFEMKYVSIISSVHLHDLVLLAYFLSMTDWLGGPYHCLLCLVLTN